MCSREWHYKKSFRVLKSFSLNLLRLSFLFRICGLWILYCDFAPHNYETSRYIISLSPPPPYPFLPSLISLMVSVDVKHHVCLLTYWSHFLSICHLHVTFLARSFMSVCTQCSCVWSNSFIIFPPTFMCVQPRRWQHPHRGKQQQPLGVSIVC